MLSPEIKEQVQGQVTQKLSHLKQTIGYAKVQHIDTFVLGYHKNITNANLASLYIGILERANVNNNIRNRDGAQMVENPISFQHTYHEIKLSPTLSKIVNIATKILKRLEQ